MNQNTFISTKIEKLKQNRESIYADLKLAKINLNKAQLFYDNNKNNYNNLANKFRSLDSQISEAYITKISSKKQHSRCCNKIKKDKMPKHLIKLINSLPKEKIEKLIKKYEMK